ncbi:MAG: hypothetical protein R3C56_27660 [Pirellulaceae bacterium]
MKYLADFANCSSVMLVLLVQLENRILLAYLNESFDRIWSVSSALLNQIANRTSENRTWFCLFGSCATDGGGLVDEILLLLELLVLART